MTAAPRLQLSLPRRLLVVAGALTGAVIMRSWSDRLPVMLWAPAALLALSAVLAQRGHIGGQLLARAILWSNLLLGTLIAISSTSSERPLGAGLAAGTGVALLALGRAGLGAAAPGAFSPAAFRGTLIATMVLAMADAQSLLLFGGLHAEDRDAAHAAPLLAAGLALLLAVAGLYRLRIWGVLLAAAASVAAAAAGLAGALDIPRPFIALLVATAAFQVVLPLPIFLALARALRGAAPGVAPGAEGLARRGHLVSSAVIAAMIALSTIGAFALGRSLIDM